MALQYGRALIPHGNRQPLRYRDSVFRNTAKRFSSTQIQEASIALNIDSKSAAKELAAFLKKAEHVKFTVEDILGAISQRSVQALSALYSSTSILGLWSQAGTMPERIRGIPALRFDGNHSVAAKYCTEIVRAMQSGTSVSSSFRPERMYRQVAKFDDSHYHGHIVHPKNSS